MIINDNNEPEIQKQWKERESRGPIPRMSQRRGISTGLPFLCYIEPLQLIQSDLSLLFVSFFSFFFSFSFPLPFIYSVLFVCPLFFSLIPLLFFFFLDLYLYFYFLSHWIRSPGNKACTIFSNFLWFIASKLNCFIKN